MPDYTGKQRASELVPVGDQYAMCGLTNRDVLQIMELLAMDQGMSSKRPDQEWLAEQEARIPKLGETLQRPSNILDRIVSRLGDLRGLSKTARLCDSHRGLNPKVIRKLMLILAAECTERTDRFRKWRRRTEYPDSITAWLDRIDDATGLWIGRRAFRVVFGYERTCKADNAVKSGCEACILAAVGGRPELLADLRASMIVRRKKYADRKDRVDHKDRKEPRLFRMVESWMLGFDADCRRAIFDASEGLATEILELKDTISVLEEVRNHERGERRKDKPARKLSKTSDRRKGDRSSSKDLSHRSGDKKHKSKSTRSMSMIPENEVAVPAERMDGSSVDEDDPEGLRTAAWLEGKVQEQRLTEDERANLFSGLHPALSDYGHRSSKPKSSRRGQGRVYPSEGENDSMVTVASVDSQGQHIPFRKRYPNAFKPPLDHRARRPEEEAERKPETKYKPEHKAGHESDHELEDVEDLYDYSGSEDEDEGKDSESMWEPYPVFPSEDGSDVSHVASSVYSEDGDAKEHGKRPVCLNDSAASSQTDVRATRRQTGTPWEGMYGREGEGDKKEAGDKLEENP